VQRPGQLRLERGMTLMQALASGGGLTARGTARASSCIAATRPARSRSSS
jgi:protein involved in polysaccharide export with SLBB domain